MKPRRSIKWKLIFLFTTMSTLPVIFLGILVLFFVARGFEQEINAKNLLLSKIFINQAEKYLDEPLKDLGAIRKTIETYGVNRSSFLLFDELLHRHEYFLKFILTDKDGYVAHVFPPDDKLIGSDMSRRKFYKKVRSSGESYWSSVFISSDGSIPITALSIPVENQILTAHLNISRLAEITGELSKTENISVSVTDQTGTYIAHSEEIKVLQREMDLHYNRLQEDYQGEIFQKTMHHNGREYICHVGFISQTGWSVMISQPFKQTYLPVRKVFWFIVSMTLMIFILSFFISYSYGAKITETFGKFLRNTRKIATGDYDTEISGLEYYEFSDLAESFHAMGREIEKREKKILESQVMFRGVFHADAVGASIINRDLTIRIVNNRWTQVTGYSKKDLEGKCVFSIIHQENREDANRLFQDLLSGKQLSGRLENKMVTRGGDEIWIDHTIALIGEQDPDCSYLVGMLVDNTEIKNSQAERVRLERKLQQAHKMEAVGSLAGGIAHDFNNILSAILGYTELALDDLSRENELRSYLKEIDKAGVRARDLVQQILSFSRKSDTEDIPVSVGLIVTDALKMIRPSIPSSIEIFTEIDPDVGYIMANPAQLHQVLVNLCTNSFQAMEREGGDLKITLSRRELKGNELEHVPHVEPGSFVLLSIKDSGPGIPETIRDKIFDPYFTTKEVGKGTGMGLSIVHGIVTKYGGFMGVESEEGRGTNFLVYFPRIDEIVEFTDKKQEVVVGGKEHLLLVDDELMVANMAKSMLEKLGYRVTVSNLSREALQLFKENPETYDLVITDQTMPKMTGIELAKALLEIRPELPIILCSGYSSVVSKQEALASGVKSFVEKPYSSSEISILIRQSLAEAS